MGQHTTGNTNVTAQTKIVTYLVIIDFTLSKFIESKLLYCSVIISWGLSSCLTSWTDLSFLSGLLTCTLPWVVGLPTFSIPFAVCRALSLLVPCSIIYAIFYLYLLFMGLIVTFLCAAFDSQILWPLLCCLVLPSVPPLFGPITVPFH